MNWTSEDVAKKMQKNKDLARMNGIGPANLCLKTAVRQVSEAKTGPVKETEADFASWVIDYAHLKGWRVAHFRPARTIKNGEVTWRTAVSADGAGFPDLVLAKRCRVIFAELKSEKGKLSNDQYRWFEALAGRSEIESYTWRPADRESIMKILESPQAGQAEGER